MIVKKKREKKMRPIAHFEGACEQTSFLSYFVGEKRNSLPCIVLSVYKVFLNQCFCLYNRCKMHF